MITRKQFLQTSLLSVAAAPAIVGAAEPAAKQDILPKAKSGPTYLIVKLKVIAADTLLPVPDVNVSATYVGPGADGGGIGSRETNQDGMVDGLQFALDNNHPTIWQIYLTPGTDSRYKSTSYQSQETMLVILPDGTYFSDHFRIALKDPYWWHPSG